MQSFFMISSKHMRKSKETTKFSGDEEEIITSTAQQEIENAKLDYFAKDCNDEDCNKKHCKFSNYK